MAIGENSIAKLAGTVSVGDLGKERKIVNVADGDISDGSTDAINGGQLFNALGALTTRAGFPNADDPEPQPDPRFAVEGVDVANTASLSGADPTEYSALAAGVNSIAGGADTAAFGLNTIAQSDFAVAIGSNAQTGTGQEYSVAIGSEVSTNGAHAIAIGEEVKANADNALAIGNNGAFAVGESSIAIGNNAMDRGQSGVVMGKNAAAAANTVSAIAVGTGAAVATGVANGIALGVSASVTAAGNGGVALGQGAVANRGNAVSLGSTTGTNPVGARQIINLAAGTQATDAVNVTQLVGVTTALGGGAGVGADGSILPPSYSVGGASYADVGAAISAAANMVDPNAVSYDDPAKDIITFGDGTSGTLLTNVNAGSVDANSVDGINGSQLFGTAQSIADGLGGGVKVNPDGTVSKPVYVIGNTSADDVGMAFANVPSVIKDQLADSGLVDQNGQAIVAVTYDGALQNSVTLGGTGAAAPVHMSNLAPGDVSSAASTDAVNGGQLFDTNRQLDAVDQAFNDLKDALDQGGVLDPSTGESLAVTYADDTKTGIALGVAGTPVTVSNLEAGTRPTDAVNINQLRGVATALGGGAGVAPDGSIVPPSYTVDGKPYPDVGTALNAVASMTDPNAVSYDGTGKDTITFGGAPGTLLTHVSAGSIAANSVDAINGSQLFVTNQAISDLQDALDNSGIIDPGTGDFLAVTYVDANKSAIDLGTAGNPVTISNVEDGALSATSTDAVNGSQLYATNQAISDLTDTLEQGGVLDPTTGESLAVTYVDTSKANVALGIAGTPVTLTNVKPGNVSSAASTDAVNGAQLFATNQAVTDLAEALDNSGVLDPSGNSLAVTYVDASKTGVTLGTAGTPVAISNVKPGALTAASTDTVNGSQLYTTNQAISDLTDTLEQGGVFDPTTGESLAVTYADASKTGVTLGTAGTPVAISNVKPGALTAASTDTVNGSQLYTTNQAISDLTDTLEQGGVFDPTTGESLAVTYADASKTGVTLGTAGTPVTISNVRPGAVTAASTDTVNGAQLYGVAQSVNSLEDVLNNSGLIDPSTGESLAVTYDDDSKDGVTLGGTSASAPVVLHNLDTGTADTDGVNVAQLTTGLSDLKSELTNGAINLKYIKVNSVLAQANANGTDAVSIGPQASATAVNAVAIGRGSRVTGSNSVAIGVNSAASQSNVLSVGDLGKERKIINVDDGDISSGSTDAVNGGQLYSVRKALEALAGAVGKNGVGAKDVLDPIAAVEGRRGDNTASLNGGDPEESTAAAVGVFSIAAGADAIAMGLYSRAASNHSVALGYMTDTGVDMDYSVAVGSRITTRGSHAVALGARVQANADHALALGSNDTSAIGKSSIAMGDGVRAYGDNSIAIGRSAEVTRNVADALALGAEARVEAAAIGGVALGHGAVADRGNAISIGGGTVGSRQIIHVSAGTEPTDAVNLAQLQEAMAAMRAEIQLLRSQLGARSAGQ